MQHSQPCLQIHPPWQLPALPALGLLVVLLPLHWTHHPSKIVVKSKRPEYPELSVQEALREIFTQISHWREMSFSYIKLPILKYDFIERTYVYLSRVICHKTQCPSHPLHNKIWHILPAYTQKDTRTILNQMKSCNFHLVDSGCTPIYHQHSNESCEMTTEQQHEASSATVRLPILQPRLLPA